MTTQLSAERRGAWSIHTFRAPLEPLETFEASFKALLCISQVLGRVMSNLGSCCVPRSKTEILGIILKRSRGDRCTESITCQVHQECPVPGTGCCGAHRSAARGPCQAQPWGRPAHPHPPRTHVPLSISHGLSWAQNQFVASSVSSAVLSRPCFLERARVAIERNGKTGQNGEKGLPALRSTLIGRLPALQALIIQITKRSAGQL